MPLTGAAKAEYMREYHRRRNASQAEPSGPVCCDFCGENASSDRILVSDYDHTVMICEHCVATAVARIAEARGL